MIKVWHLHFIPSDLNTYLPCGSLDPADFQHELEAPRARLSLARAVLQEIPRQVLLIFASRLNHAVQILAHKSNSHPCVQFQSFADLSFQVVEYMRAAGISPKVPDIPDIPDDTLEEDFDKRFNM